MEMELRINSTKLKSDEDGTLTVFGYVNKTGELSEVLGATKRFVEKISKGAFARAIQKVNGDIDFLAEHNSKLILASTRNNSLKLKEDNVGLYMEAKIAPTSWGKDYYELIKSGIHQNMSFGFRTVKDSWRSIENGLYERTIEELELFEVSVVKEPAYSQSTIAARSIKVINDPEINIEVIKEQENNTGNQISRLKLEILDQENSVDIAKRANEFLANEISNNHLERNKKKLEEMKNELSKLEEEQEIMKTEERKSQGITEGQSTISQQVAPIWELLEASSNVVAEARKIELIGANMKIPYETNLDNAAFVWEEENLPMVNLNLKDRDELTGKRVGVAQNFSNFLLNESKGLSEHSKELLIRRVGKQIEEQILTGDNVKGLKGIAPDLLVPSVDFDITPTQTMLRALYLKVNAEYRPYCKWYMSEEYFEKIASMLTADSEPLVKEKYLVKSKTSREKVVPTLWGHEIEITTALEAGGNTGEVPIIFASISDCYTLAVAKDIEFMKVNGITEALNGSTSFKAEALLDGCCHNYQAVSRGIIA